MISETKRCNHCILPNSCDLIPFDSDGTCKLCKAAKSQPSLPQESAAAEQTLEDHIQQIRQKGAGRRYDCVVGVSGGRDSTYLLSLLVKKHNLRCLAVYYQTPFTSETIDTNIRRIVRELGVDFEPIQLSQEYHRKIARKMVLLWKKKQHRLIINLACAPCKLLNREMYRIAHKHGVPTIIYGTNIYEAVQIAPGISKKQAVIRGSAQVSSMTRKIKHMFSLLSAGVKLIVEFPVVLRHLWLGVKSSVMYISPNTFYLALRYPGIKTFNYFYDGRWDEEDCRKTLDELGWQRPPGCNTSWKADCSFAEIKNKMLHQTIGITYADAFFSNMVRAGAMSRQEALDRIQTEGKISEQRLKEVQDILELDEKFWQ